MNNILHLKYAIEVEKAGSISKAAETLYLAQPHLSKAIRELESSLGAAIFKRTSRGVIPTARGKEFLRRARVALRQLEGMEEIFKPSSHIRHALDLCVPPSCYLFEALNLYLQALDPGQEVELQFRHAHANGTMNRIADGEENLGILRYQSLYEPYYRKALQDKELRFKEIWEFSYRLLCSGTGFVSDLEEDADQLPSSGTLVLHGDAALALPPKCPECGIVSEPAGKRITVYDKAFQLDLIRRFPGCYTFEAPVPQDVLTRYGLIQKHFSLPENHYKDVLIFRSGYEFTDDDLLYYKMLKEVIATLADPAV